MTSLKRRIACAGAPVLLALSLTACGSDSSDSSEAAPDAEVTGAAAAPADASKDDFCEAYTFEPDFPDDPASLSEDEQVSLVSDTLQQIQDKLASVGTPSDIPDDARAGYELSVDAVGSLNEDEIRAAVLAQEDPFTDLFGADEQQDVDAFDSWSKEYCA